MLIRVYDITRIIINKINVIYYVYYEPYEVEINSIFIIYIYKIISGKSQFFNSNAFLSILNELLYWEGVENLTLDQNQNTILISTQWLHCQVSISP